MYVHSLFWIKIKKIKKWMTFNPQEMLNIHNGWYKDNKEK